MRRLILIAVLVHACSIGAFAQKVYKEGDKVILDLSVAAGMPAGAVDANSKSWGNGTPSNDGGPILNNTPDGSINLKVYPKLEIAPYDMNSVGVISSATTGTFTMDWATAFNGCKNAKYPSTTGGWRLPTQRELMYMWIFKAAFDALLPTSFFSSSSYWSAIENLANTSWHVRFDNGFMSTDYKTTRIRVRCVREVTP